MLNDSQYSSLIRVARTRRMDEANEKFNKRDEHRNKASAAEDALRLRELEHPDLATLKLGQRVFYVSLCLLLLAPYIPDPVLLYPAITDLLKNNLGVTDRFSRVMFTLAFVSVQIFAVWSLAFFGKSRRGWTGIFLAAVGLLIATAVPVITVATAIAQSSAASMKPLLEMGGLSLNVAQQSAPPSVMDAIKENMHLICLSVFSLAFHSLIWAFAVDIAKAIEVVPNLWLNARDRRRAVSERLKGEAWDREADLYLTNVFNTDEIVNARWGAREEGPKLRFIREPLDPRIVGWYAKWQQRKTEEPALQKQDQEKEQNRAESAENKPQSGNAA